MPFRLGVRRSPAGRGRRAALSFRPQLWRNSAAIASTPCWLRRAWTRMPTPGRARRRAIAAPMPLPEPVTSTDRNLPTCFGHLAPRSQRSGICVRRGAVRQLDRRAAASTLISPHATDQLKLAQRRHRLFDGGHLLRGEGWDWPPAFAHWPPREIARRFGHRIERGRPKHNVQRLHLSP